MNSTANIRSKSIEGSVSQERNNEMEDRNGGGKSNGTTKDVQYRNGD